MAPPDFVPQALLGVLAAVRAVEPGATLDWAPLHDYERLAGEAVTVAPSPGDEPYAVALATRGGETTDTLRVALTLAARLAAATPEAVAAQVARLGAMQRACLAARPAGGAVTAARWATLCDPELLRRGSVYLGALELTVRRVG